ncbi:hypothetical protein D3C87_1352860 [compost metagenome]
MQCRAEHGNLRAVVADRCTDSVGRPAQRCAEAAANAARRALRACGVELHELSVEVGEHMVGNGAERDVGRADRPVGRTPRMACEREQALRWCYVAQQRPRRDALCSRHRHGVPAHGHEDRKDRVQVEPGTAGVFARHQFEESALGQRSPQRGGRSAVLDCANGGRRAVVNEDRLDGFGEHVRFSLWRAQRRPRPRAIMPRRISRVPPRSEKVGEIWLR